MTRSFDLLSIGGGIAGLAAAARASELGLRTAVIEAGTSKDYMCATRVSSGVFHVAYQDGTVGEAALAEAIRQASKGSGSLEQADAIASEAGRALVWLRDQGIRFVRAISIARGAWMAAPPRRQVTRLEWKGLGSDVMIRSLTEQINSRGGEFYLGTKALELVMEGQACRGIIAEKDGKRIEIKSSAVVLADGGFSANVELLNKHISPAPDRVLQRSAATSRGDALRMAVAVGAATSELSGFYGHLLSLDAFHNDDLWPYPQIDALASAGVIVDRSGRRLFDEGLGGIYAANHLATLPDPASGVVIIGNAIWEEAGGQGMVPANPHLERHGGTVFRANTIEDLASAAGLSAHDLLQTVQSHNAALQACNLGSLKPPRSNDKNTAQPIEPPYLAIPVCVGITHTLGGVLVDRQARVLHADGSPITGLYAAGAATGGLEGGPEVCYIGGLIKGLVFGLLAAENAFNTQSLEHLTVSQTRT